MMQLSVSRIGALAAGVILLLVFAVCIPQLIENQDAGEVMIIQSVSGGLDCTTDPGPKWQGLGKVTTYPRRGTYLFDVHAEKLDTGKPLQFNDGGTATLYGSVNWQMPLDCKRIIAIHREFGSKTGIEENGVARMVNTAIQLSGSTMTSLESFAERKAELIEIINDQAQGGAYQMVTEQVERVNPISQQPEKAMVARIVRGKGGLAMRQHGSILEQYGVTLQPMSVEKIIYSKPVQDQIATQQAAKAQVFVSQSNAQKAIQAAITAEKDGQAAAATEKWKQEAIKAREVTLAEQKLRVAELAASEAAQYKRQQVLIGEGDAERRKLVMSADGALDAKLKAYVDVQRAWAENFAKFPGGLVPQVQIGSGAGANSVGTAQALVDMLTARTAKDLALDASPRPGK
jgi:hypothetical protein